MDKEVMEGKSPEVESKTGDNAGAEGTAPEMDKTEMEADAPDEQDIANVISILNEIKVISGGNGDITEISPQLLGAIKPLVDNLTALEKVFKDPLYQVVIDDMVGQAEEGKTPSILVAIARNIPIEELQNLADNENYGDIQGAVDERVGRDEEGKKAEEALYANFDKTKSEFESYCEEMAYDETQKKELWSTVVTLMKIFGDGYLSKNEFREVDKMRNYEKDIESYKAQIPSSRKKEVLPDKASIDASMAPKAPVQSSPKNSIEQMAAISPMTDVTEIGKRKRTAAR